MTVDMLLRLAADERAVAIIGRVHYRLQAIRVRGVVGLEVATYKICRDRLRGAAVTMTVQARDVGDRDAAKAVRT